MFGREKLELLFRAEASIAFFGAAVYEICDGGVLTNFLPSKSTNSDLNHLTFGKQVIFEYSVTVLILFFTTSSEIKRTFVSNCQVVYF